MNLSKEAKKELIISSALELFLQKGINETKITDIAEKSGVGVASVYRYFENKTNILICAATLFWQKEINKYYEMYNRDEFKNLNGLEKIKSLLYSFLEIYNHEPQFFSFLEQFDNYIKTEHVSSNLLKNYEENILNLKDLILVSIEQGKNEGLIRKDLNSSEFYITVTHSLMSLCQKLILRGDILESDNIICANAQIELLIKMSLNYISNK
ncbi:transcriptional regulator, TetR family [Caloramator quimbayensis]|uniref:Transcriptional regulator, TetR family n=1 Tax=Caloramator quimbayensis TaxID=1147123 RepID=A0A1T4WS26_9CLOT|nr:TetR/AcrR family transcriptional regulator [Caloramator quimbayensis]SKA80136.1 transcriptional regulator, TetR family [Caloramator quimbayensis]